jgi:hypothetical protein
MTWLSETMLAEAMEMRDEALRQATAWSVPRELPPFSIVSPWSYPPAVLAGMNAPFCRIRPLALALHWAWAMRRPL